MRAREPISLYIIPPPDRPLLMRHILVIVVVEVVVVVVVAVVERRVPSESPPRRSHGVQVRSRCLLWFGFLLAYVLGHVGRALVWRAEARGRSETAGSIQ